LDVSIVTIVKDHVFGLKSTHESLRVQSFIDWQMIIVVGASDDKTLVFARELQSNDTRVHVIEQNGNGIYGAMNEGLAAAAGDYIWFMNSGDQFATTSALGHAVQTLQSCDAGLVIGDYRVANYVNARHRVNLNEDISILSFAFNRQGGCHQAMIFRRETLIELGGFDTKYSLAGDFSLVLKIIKKNKAKRVSEVYALIEPGGRADQGIITVHKQKHQIRRELLGGPSIFIASIVWTYLARTKIVIRRTRYRWKRE
jgi:glycosyltransferase involved in cell wall biosynthesis